MEHSERGCNRLSKREGGQRTSYMQTERRGGQKRQVGERAGTERGVTLERLTGDFEAGQRSEPHPDPSLTCSHAARKGLGIQTEHLITLKSFSVISNARKSIFQ